MALPRTLIFVPGTHDHLLPAIAVIHIDCIEADYTLATFLPPFDRSDEDNSDGRIMQYWRQRVAQVATGSRVILLQMMPSKNHDGEELAGYVSLDMQGTETGPFRGSVEKLLVSPSFRKRGVAKILMAELENIAREKGTTLLYLDTEVGSAAEMVYPRLGYTRVGVIPRFGVSPKDGRLVDEVFFYKDLGEAR